MGVSAAWQSEQASPATSMATAVRQRPLNPPHMDASPVLFSAFPAIAQNHLCAAGYTGSGNS